MEKIVKRYWDGKLFLALIVTSVPFLLGALLLETYGPSGTPFNDLSLCNLKGEKSFPESGKITYVAVTNLHYVVCTIVIIRYWTLIRDVLKTTDKPQIELRCYILPIAIVLLPLFALLFVTDLSWPRLSLSECSKNDWSIFSKCEFYIASILPAFMAIFAVASLVAYTSLQVRLFGDSAKEEHDSKFSASHEAVMKCIVMYSCILVTAVISSAVWLHLPLSMYVDVVREASVPSLRIYADEMTLFLGMTYTLTAFVAVAWPLWRLSRTAHDLHYRPKWKFGRQRLDHETVLLVARVLAVLGPLITSLLYNWLDGSV